ncbi:hypothetical protein IAI53_05220 [Thauera sp. CAU 1555]|uniref:Uncharacterized protein n=1 Tax=Thauera sedimentorum TaxID=2767595 RepID=A0ABR9B7D0_9RHOO|nr:hypothetical protein [Thauera sedimentorum]MBC9071355.1 hypothetical protein [Thauera sedimentorum]MBD8502274.1 hypothetical protein [Thauera sedimentorum]
MGHSPRVMLARATGWLRARWRRLLAIALVVAFFYLLGYFTPRVSSPGMCLIYG